MERRKILDKRQVKLEDIMRSDYIPFLEGRPDRDTVIGKDDLSNLKITLNLYHTVDELITVL